MKTKVEIKQENGKKWTSCYESIEKIQEIIKWVMETNIWEIEKNITITISKTKK